MRASFHDLRERVLNALDTGTSCAAVATTFRVRERTIRRWWARGPAGLSLAGGTGPGRPPAISEAALPELRAHVQAPPDAPLAQHLAAWNAHHAPVSQSALIRAIQQLGWARKKRRSLPAIKTP